MKKERPLVRSTTPCLIVSNLQQTLDFYCAKLGFVEPGMWGEPPCFAMANRNEVDMMFSLAASPEQVRPNGPFGVWDFYIRVDDARAEAEAIKATGLELTAEIRTTFYGLYEFEVTDPDGYRICIASEIE